MKSDSINYMLLFCGKKHGFQKSNQQTYFNIINAIELNEYFNLLNCTYYISINYTFLK